MSSSLLSAHRSRVFASYRRIFRARKDLFQGDVVAMMESRKAIKAEFAKNVNADTNNAQHIDGLISMVDEAVDMMKHGVVRGELNATTGNYGTYEKSSA